MFVLTKFGQTKSAEDTVKILFTLAFIQRRLSMNECAAHMRRVVATSAGAHEYAAQALRQRRIRAASAPRSIQNADANGTPAEAAFQVWYWGLVFVTVN